MEYCYSGTESFWYGIWNRPFCHKWKCEVDRPSRSTGLDPDKNLFYQRAAFLFPNQIYYCRLVGMVRLQTSIYNKRDDFNFRSLVVIFLLHRAIEVSSHNSYDTPGLVPHMNVLFWGPGDFPVSYSNRVTSLNNWNRHSWSFIVDTGILLNNMKCPSFECLNDNL